MEKKIKHSSEIDFLRILGCIGVVSIHFSMAYGTRWILPVRVLVAGSVPLFMSISGYLLFYKKEYTYKEILRDHFLRYLILFEIWKALYIFSAWMISDDGTWKGIFRFAVENADGWHLWYLRVYLAVLLCYPIIQSITKKREACILFSVLWIIVFCLRYSLATWQSLPPNILRLFNLPFFQYTSLISGTIKGFYPMEALGAFIAGGFLIDCFENNAVNQIWLKVTIIFFALFSYFLTLYTGYKNHIETFAYLCDPYMINVMFIIVGVITIGYIIIGWIQMSKLCHLLDWLSDKTLGVYVLQGFVNRWITKLLDYFEVKSPYVRKPVIYFGVLVGGVFLTALIKKIIPRRFSKYIV